MTANGGERGLALRGVLRPSIVASTGRAAPGFRSRCSAGIVPGSLDMKIGLVDAATVAKVVGVSRQRIKNLVADGVLPRADRGRFDLPSTVQAFCAHKYAKLQACDADAKSLTIERSRLARL